MRRFPKLRTSLPARSLHPSATRLYSTEYSNVDANTPKTLHDEVEVEASAADEPDLDALFRFGEASAEINHQNKTLKTAVGSLPISPLLDPAWRKAREPGKKRKPPPFERMNRFQKRTKQNPYAQLLAEPVRSCHVTRARLPRSFVQGFGLVTHPETNDLWWIPAGFEQPSTGAATKIVAEPEAQNASEDESGSSNETTATQATSLNELSPAVTAAEHAATTAEAQETSPTNQNGNFWAPAHILARQDLLQEFLDKKSKYGGGHLRFGFLQGIGGLVGKATWRKDMHEVLRERMRREIVDELLDVSQACEKGLRDYLVKIDAPQDSLKYQNKNCFLRLTGEYTPFDHLEVPGVSGSARPVYHLPELLGAEQMQRLTSASPLFGDDSPLRESPLVLLKGKGNIELNKKLWKLQGFVADYAELS